MPAIQKINKEIRVRLFLGFSVRLVGFVLGFTGVYWREITNILYGG